MFSEEPPIQEWAAGGTGKDVAGWHCSWCFDVDGIRTKLVSAMNADFPRWGDYPAKQNASYIKRLIAQGIWFDDVSRMKRYDVILSPTSLFRNQHRYWKLTHNVYDNATVHFVYDLEEGSTELNEANLWLKFNPSAKLIAGVRALMYSISDPGSKNAAEIRMRNKETTRSMTIAITTAILIHFTTYKT